MLKAYSASVFMLNYSWTHSGLWTIFKSVGNALLSTVIPTILIQPDRQLLPESALSRIFFPSHSELLDYFTPAALPQGKDAVLRSP